MEIITPIYPTNLGVVFESDSFSPFALAWRAKNYGSTGAPNTGDDFNVVPIIIIAGVAAVAAMAVLIIKKKKEAAE